MREGDNGLEAVWRGTLREVGRDLMVTIGADATACLRARHGKRPGVRENGVRRETTVRGLALAAWGVGVAVSFHRFALAVEDVAGGVQ